MAITYWPKHGENNTENSFAQYADKLFGYADHASSDTAFQLRFTSTDGTNDTWTLSSGSYVFDGYVFTAEGTETVTTVHATATDVYLYYHLDANSHIDATGIAVLASVPSGANSLRLWKVQNGAVTDYRQVFTWGRQSYASASGSAVSFLSSREVMIASGGAAYDASAIAKRFRAGYPGTVRLDFDAKNIGGALPGRVKVYSVRGSSKTELAYYTDLLADGYTSKTLTVTGLMAGDYIELQGVQQNTYMKNFRIRYMLTDAPTAAVLVD